MWKARTIHRGRSLTRYHRLWPQRARSWQHKASKTLRQPCTPVLHNQLQNQQKDPQWYQAPNCKTSRQIHSGIRPQTAKPAEDPQRYQAPNCKTSRRSTAVSGPKLQNQQKIHSGIRPQTAKPTERFIAVSGPKLQNLQKSPLRHQARTSKPGPNAKNRRKTNNHNRKTSEGQVHPTARSRSSRPHKLQRNSTPAPHQSTSLAPFWNNTVSTRPRPLSATGSVVP
jgi:hypothetical protein